MTAAPKTAKAPHVSHVTAKQLAADRANLKKARAVARRLPRTAKQKAASRRNLVIARAAQKARRSGKNAVTAKKAAAPLETRANLALLGEDPGSNLLALELLALPVCAPLALAAHLQAYTGAVAPAEEILALHHELGGAASLGDMFELAAIRGFAGDRIAWFERCDPDCGAPGLVYGIRLYRGYHAALAVPGAMTSWCRLVPRDGTPEEAWWLEWEGE